MALSNDEKQALIELKNNGYSFDDAMGFIASSRAGHTSKVERELTTPETTTRPNDAMSDLKAGFSGAKDSFNAGLQRDLDIEQQNRSKASELFGKFAGGVRTAGSALGNLAGGAIRALPGGTTVMDKVEDVAGKAVEKAKNTTVAKKATDTFEQLPTGVQQTLGDVGNVALGGAELAGGLVAPTVTGALAKGVSEFAKSGIKETGQQGIQMSLKSGLEPEDLMQRVARISKGKQAKFEERAGQSVGSYLVDRGIFGDPEAITEQLYQRMQTSKARVDNGLAKVGGTYKNDSVADALEQLEERESRVSSTRTASPDQKRVKELLNKHESEGLTLKEVNEVKRLYERNIKLDFLRDNVSDGIAKANNIDNKLRDFVEEKASQGGFNTVKELNKETTLAKQLMDDLGAEYAGQQGNNFVSLSDAFFLAEAANNPTALLAFGLKKALSGKSTMSAVARLMAKNREKQGLPSGDVNGALSLPPAGQTSAPPEVPIPLGSRTQSTIDRQERERIENQRN